MEDIRDILTELGYNLRDYGKEYRARPLYRESDNDTILTIEKSTGKWYDFKESRGGSLEDLVRLTLKLDTKEKAKEWVSKKQTSPSAEVKESKPFLKSQRILPKETLDNLVSIHDYWIERGISAKTLEIFQGGVMTAGRMKNRYTFPIFNSRKELVGLSGRDLVNKSSSEFTRPKWKHLGDKSLWRYPLQVNYKILKEEKQVFLVESIGDMLSLWEAGVTNSVVTFGLDVSTSIVNLLLRLDPDKIFVSLNNDAANNNAGNAAAKKMERKLLKYFDISQVSVKLPTKNDFGEMNKQEVIEWYAKI